MEPREELLCSLIRHVKDAYIVFQLYPPEDSISQIEMILEEAALKIALYERPPQSEKGGDRG